MVCIFSVALIFWHSVQLSTEQISADFFVEEILAKEYKNQDAIYFSGLTENLNSLAAPIPKCFPSDRELVEYFYATKPEATEVSPINFKRKSGLKLLKKPRRKCPIVSIYRSVKFNESDFVYISVYLQDSFVDHYLIKIKNDKVVGYCKVNEVI